jgi:hypothetical protein
VSLRFAYLALHAFGIRPLDLHTHQPQTLMFGFCGEIGSAA